MWVKRIFWSNLKEFKNFVLRGCYFIGNLVSYLGYPILSTLKMSRKLWNNLKLGFLYVTNNLKILWVWRLEYPPKKIRKLKTDTFGCSYLNPLKKGIIYQVDDECFPHLVVKAISKYALKKRLLSFSIVM